MMAKRFGGKYSPNSSAQVGKDTVHSKRRSRARGPVNLLFFAPIPFALKAFALDPSGLLHNLLVFGLLILAAWLTREGIIAQEAYDERSVAKRPAIPRKLFAAILTGVALFIGGMAAGSLLTPFIFAILGFALHVFAFGPDPLKDKGMEGIDSYQSNRVARAVDEAEKHLTAMKDAILRAKDRELETRVDNFQATAREMFRTVEADPRDLVAARRYLGVYLLGAKDATVKFVDLWNSTRDPQARTDYEQLLADLEANFSARTQTLLADDRDALDIEIGVLRERLEREGISTDDRGEA